jgi:hypothetical protein
MMDDVNQCLKPNMAIALDVGWDGPADHPVLQTQTDHKYCYLIRFFYGETSGLKFST